MASPLQKVSPGNGALLPSQRQVITVVPAGGGPAPAQPRPTSTTGSGSQGKFWASVFAKAIIPPSVTTGLWGLSLLAGCDAQRPPADIAEAQRLATAVTAILEVEGGSYEGAADAAWSVISLVWPSNAKLDGDALRKVLRGLEPRNAYYFGFALASEGATGRACPEAAPPDTARGRPG
jgi:hypothetical protein